MFFPTQVRVRVHVHVYNRAYTGLYVYICTCMQNMRSIDVYN